MNDFEQLKENYMYWFPYITDEQARELAINTINKKCTIIKRKKDGTAEIR